jgi:hypothetical protein
MRRSLATGGRTGGGLIDAPCRRHHKAILGPPLAGGGMLVVEGRMSCWGSCVIGKGCFRSGGAAAVGATTATAVGPV